jgi:two-component system, chemotaxis family, protein-glutamate methylesterase/glutaminase
LPTSPTRRRPATAPEPSVEEGTPDNEDDVSTPIRVLLVDDSAVVRHLVADILRTEDGIEVVGVAENGRRGLERIEALRPDVVVCDVEMPELDGLATLRELRPRWPRLPVIMFSTLTERGAASTLSALAAGANDYVTKPGRLAGRGEAEEAVRQSLVPLVRNWGRLARSRPVASSVTPRAPSARPMPVSAVVLGSSTGGPVALGNVIPHLPANLAVPVIIVQHMPPVFTRMLAERLNERSALTVVEAADGMIVERGTVYIAPGGNHAVVRRSGTDVVIALDDGPAENSCKPAVDVLFRSAVPVWGGSLLAVVLTGMGQDGLEGVKPIVAAGGSAIVQDEASSVVWGMPGAVAQAGLAEQILPLDDIPGAIQRRVARDSIVRTA